jgi:hypothetical protein
LPPDASRSAVTANPGTVQVGQTTTITVTVRDAADAPLSGRTVVLNGGTDSAISPASAQTGSDGTAAFSFTPTSPGTQVLTAAAGDVTLGTATVEVQPGP